MDVREMFTQLYGFVCVYWLIADGRWKLLRPPSIPGCAPKVGGTPTPHIMPTTPTISPVVPHAPHAPQWHTNAVPHVTDCYWLGNNWAFLNGGYQVYLLPWENGTHVASLCSICAHFIFEKSVVENVIFYKYYYVHPHYIMTPYTTLFLNHRPLDILVKPHNYKVLRFTPARFKKKSRLDPQKPQLEIS